jgi:hypothetical protein
MEEIMRAIYNVEKEVRINISKLELPRGGPTSNPKALQ